MIIDFEIKKPELLTLEDINGIIEKIKKIKYENSLGNDFYYTDGSASSDAAVLKYWENIKKEFENNKKLSDKTIEELNNKYKAVIKSSKEININKKAEEFKDEYIPEEDPGVKEDIAILENEELRKDIRVLLDFIFDNALITEIDIPDRINEIDNKYFR